MTTAGVMKETVLIGTLNIAIPTSDVYSDGVQIYRFYRGNPYHPNCETWDTEMNQILNATFDKLTINETCFDGIPKEKLEYDHHPIWATLLLIPFLLNYTASWYAWYQLDNRKQFTWLACLVGLYPQLRAGIVIRELWRDPKKGLAEKKKFERELSENEVFFEAVPTTFILTYIACRLRNFINSNKSNVRAGVYLDSTLVFTLFTSIITAGLGMAKALKGGVCKILPSDKGLLGGFLSLRFILIFLASFFTLFSKAGVASRGILDTPILENLVLNSISNFLIVILPGIIIGIIFIRHRDIFKTFLNHPSLLLLPMFTFFSFSSNSKRSDNAKNDASPNEVEICFSVKATIFNILLSCFLDALRVPFYIQKHDSTFLLVLLFFSLFFTILLLLTICKQPSSCTSPSSSSSSSSTFSTSCSSCLSSFSASCFPPLEFGVYLPSSPCKVFIKDQTEPSGRREVKEIEEEETRERNEEEEV